MWILDRYLLRQFIRSFLICFLSLAGLAIVFDAFTHLDDFIHCAEKQDRNLLAMIGTHYAFQTISFFDRTSGLLTLIAAMFAVSWFQRHNELVAIEAAGISRLRVAVPILGAAVAITACSAMSRETVMPRFREELSQKPQEMTENRELAPRYDNHTDVLLRGKSTVAAERRIVAPNFLLPSTLDRYGNELIAENAYYRSPTTDRPGGYLLDGIELPGDLAAKPSLTLDGEIVILTPRDAPGWLEPDQCFVVSELSFVQLTSGGTWRQLSSTRELIAGLRNESLGFGADVRVAIHARLVRPFLDITLMFLGLPLVLARQSRNVFISMGLCLVVVSIFSLTVLGFQHLGSIYSVAPAMAAWAPLMIFVPLAVAMSESLWR